MNKLVVFDLDGTIVDSMPLWAQEGVAVLKEAGVKDYAKIMEMFSTMTAKAIAEYVDRYSLANRSDERLIAVWRERMARRYEQEIPLKSGAKELVERLFAEGRRIVLASGTPRRYTIEVLKKHDLYRYFSAIYDETSFGVAKKDPTYYTSLAKKEGFLPSETTVIDDSTFAIEAAKKAGCEAIAVYDEISKNWRRRLTEVADRYVESLAELTSS